ncbi:MAG: DNA polymerase III subunit delta' [Proteobacteria bacterium]|nr:DNA polymerase III subunit delta' [Pseudomonadota bacterium]
MVAADGVLPLPWLDEPLARALQTQRGHAVLLQGPPGIGQFDLALCLAQAWLCEDAAGARRPCGRCASCRLVQARSHPDLLVLLPEALRQALGWEEEASDGAGEKSGKAKPSKEIKVDAVRAAVGFAQSTSARGRAKVIVVHPAERMNPISANTLLKTLEEPPGLARFVLSSGAPEALLPTIRSRCQALALSLPPADQAEAWLAGQGVARPEVLLRACGGQPLEALEWSRQGVDAAAWTKLPAQVARGDGSALAAWPLPRLLDALQKLCHDAASVAAGAAPRYYAPRDLPTGASLERLTAWYRDLHRLAGAAEHPWNAGLALDALVQQGRAALAA